MIREYSHLELSVLCEPCHIESHAEKEDLSAIISAIPVGVAPIITDVLLGFCWNTTSLTYEEQELLPVTSRGMNVAVYLGGLVGRLLLFDDKSVVALCDAAEFLCLQNGGELKVIVPPRKGD